MNEYSTRLTMDSHLFYLYGETCSSHPWEVIVTTITITICILTVDKQQPSVIMKPERFCRSHDYSAIDMIVMTIIRCFAVLYSYYQFRNLQKLGSKYVLGIAGLFTVFSSFIFTSTLLNFLHINLTDLKDAMFFFLLLIDLSKATMLARFALNACNETEVKNNIAKGMAILGPTITLDTVVETLVIGIGTLSGVHRLEMLSYFACLSVIVNYIVFMTFYPSCLSLILELSKKRSPCLKKTVNTLLLTQAFIEGDQKPNPVVQRVKIIMSFGLSLVHIISRWPIDKHANFIPLINQEYVGFSNDNFSHSYILKWLSLGADHIVVLILLFALVIKFIFFESQAETETSLLLKCHDTMDKEVQVDLHTKINAPEEPTKKLEECLNIYKVNFDASSLKDIEIVNLVKSKHIPLHDIEKAIRNPNRAVKIRRHVMKDLINIQSSVENIPFENYDYHKVFGTCCENVIGFMPIPLGIVGPLKLDGCMFYIPMATTEGCLIASTSRGCRAVSAKGIASRIVNDGMTRGPVVRFSSLIRATDAMLWIQQPDNFELIKEIFDSTSRYARLTKIHARIAGRYLFIRFAAKTGDAMGMNMLSKGTEKSLKFLQCHFEDMEILSLSGNFCTDKKASALNWIEGRGKSVVCESVVPANVVSSILKTTVHGLIDVNISKNLIGSAISGSIGGYNAHAANIVTAIFIATGQDPAQNVVSSNCMTLMEPWGDNGEDLYISCTMPSIEIGTVGGGTILTAQKACLQILGVQGGNVDSPGSNASQLAKIVCGTVLAGELSLMAALTAGHLVKSHLKHNRSTSSIID